MQTWRDLVEPVTNMKVVCQVFIGGLYFTDSPGYLLMSDAHGMSYYFTVSFNLEVAAALTFVPFTEEDFIMSDGISGNV